MECRYRHCTARQQMSRGSRLRRRRNLAHIFRSDVLGLQPYCLSVLPDGDGQPEEFVLAEGVMCRLTQALKPEFTISDPLDSRTLPVPITFHDYIVPQFHATKKG